MNDDTEFEPIELNALSPGNGLDIAPPPAKPKRKRRKAARPRAKKLDPILAASKASAPTSPAHVASGAQPREEGPAVSPDSAGPLPLTGDHEAAYQAAVFQCEPQPDYEPPLPIVPVYAFADLTRGQVRFIGGLAAAVLALAWVLVWRVW